MFWKIIIVTSQQCFCWVDEKNVIDRYNSLKSDDNTSGIVHYLTHTLENGKSKYAVASYSNMHKVRSIKFQLGEV